MPSQHWVALSGKLEGQLIITQRSAFATRSCGIGKIGRATPRVLMGIVMARALQEHRMAKALMMICSRRVVGIL